MHQTLRRLLPLAALALGGCISFTGKPPAMLLTISAAAAPAVGGVSSSAQVHTVTVQVPVTPAAIANNRVAVQSGPNSIAYVKGGVWAEYPARLFARLLSDTVAARTGRVVLSNAQSFADPGARLAGELRAFQIDAPSGQAVVTFDASLMRDNAKTFEKRRFEARVPLAGAITPAASAAALNQGANEVATQVADWLGR